MIKETEYKPFLFKRAWQHNITFAKLDLNKQQDSWNI